MYFFPINSYRVRQIKLFQIELKQTKSSTYLTKRYKTLYAYLKLRGRFIDKINKADRIRAAP